jgi:hypothetical protein
MPTSQTLGRVMGFGLFLNVLALFVLIVTPARSMNGFIGSGACFVAGAAIFLVALRQLQNHEQQDGVTAGE